MYGSKSPPGYLNDEKKRWLIVGICLHSVISPLLRNFVNPIISKLYDSLVSSDSVDTQGYNGYMKKYPATNEHFLIYKSINNNMNVAKKMIRHKWVNDYQKYDYKVTSHVDLSKLFLQPHMVHYSGIDESCDTSALLGMVINISTFSTTVRTDAKKMRVDIRNPWAHCDFREWTRRKYTDSFKLMSQLVKDLDLSNEEEKRILSQLNTWETNGLIFLSGTPLGLEEVCEIRRQTRVLSEYVQNCSTENYNQNIKVQTELKYLENDLQETWERIRNLESKTEEQDEKIKKLTEEVMKKQVEDLNPTHIRDLQASAEDKEIRIVLLGRTGAGKSATGNSLLGRNYFLSKNSGTSVTGNCKRGESERKGKNVVIVDTPGLFDTKTTNEAVTKEIVKCIVMTSPGPHAMVLVVSVGRFTQEEEDTVKHFINHFGEGVFRHMIVLFTKKDELIRHNQSIDQYVETVPNELKTILSQCRNRFIAFYNDPFGHSKTEQVDDFFEMIEAMCSENGGYCYTNELYKEAESGLKRRMLIEKEALEKQKEEEKQTIRNEVQDKYKKKLEQEKKEKTRLEEALNSNKKESEKNKVNLQKQLQEASEKLNRELEKKEKELQDQIKKTEDEFQQKMTENALRKNQRNNVENEKDGLLSDIMGGLISLVKLVFRK
ncbi:reticulocyte-binding protein homolog 2a-like isoform X2 [Mytilus californianus]|uniref:reticulocyte-binding protein homolog 2a-like isoform X2 n=1 Tax=Mytilus californianus TaxID=6549 RepID=UPI0022482495|nr:reticulocyte-binding protein homolog 2a-like isoform X2 [Mytilus californianus]